MFGGLQSSGSIRLHTNDIFLLDLAASRPSWQYLSGGTHPAGSSVEGEVKHPAMHREICSLLERRCIAHSSRDYGGVQVWLGETRRLRDAWYRIGSRGAVFRLFVWD